MTVKFTSKLPNIGKSVFSEIAILANKHNTTNLSAGFPDFQCPEELRELVSFYMNKGMNQYAPVIGVSSLLLEISKKIENLYERKINHLENITVTSGATEAIYSAIQAVIHKEDEVIIFDPCYDSYEPAILLAGGKPVHITLKEPNFRINWDAVNKKITDRTRLIIINNPHNPTGSILSKEDIDQLARTVLDKEIFIISDEVYEHIVFDSKRHESILRHKELAKRSFAVFSFGKIYHITGWKIGYCVAPKELTNELRKIHQFVTFDTCTPMQFAIAEFLNRHPSFHLNLANFYQKKRDLFCQLLGNSKFKTRSTEGTFFQLVDYSEITDLNDVEYNIKLIKEAGLAAIPISVFYENAPDLQFLRFCFAKDDKTLKNAAEILCQI